jgi:hypothetical protein
MTEHAQRAAPFTARPIRTVSRARFPKVRTTGARILDHLAYLRPGRGDDRSLTLDIAARRKGQAVAALFDAYGAVSPRKKNTPLRGDDRSLTVAALFDAYGAVSPRKKNTPLRSSVVLIATRPALFVSRNDVTRNW